MMAPSGSSGSEEAQAGENSSDDEGSSADGRCPESRPRRRGDGGRAVVPMRGAQQRNREPRVEAGAARAEAERQLEASTSPAYGC